MSDIKKMPIEQFLALGYLQELNRRFLHPLGLALELTVVNDGAGDMTRSVASIWDYRDDPEGIIFDEEILDALKAKFIYDESAKKTWKRFQTLGYIIQPVPGGPVA